jgi:hypothetical protein
MRLVRRPTHRQPDPPALYRLPKAAQEETLNQNLSAKLLIDCADTIQHQNALLERALEIIQSAYACPEWLRWSNGRTERTDETFALVMAAVGHADSFFPPEEK